MSRHLIGFVGEGMLDVAISGDIFVAPEEDIAIKALELADRGKGVIFVVLNHEGDLLTGERATAACRARGIDVHEIITQEDISSAPRSRGRDRRGLVGCILLYKIVGAAAAMGKSVDEVAAIGQRFADQMATLTVGVRGATHPVTGKLLAEFGEDDMEIGMGQHGEEGGGRTKLKTADETAEIMLDALLRDLQIRSGEKIMLVLDGMGATTMMELFIVYRRCASYLKEKNIEIAANYEGNLLTVQEAAGFQMFIARMDDELLAMWNAPCNTPYFKK
jgi:dihydroxyacetone kinase-like protein